MAALVLWLWRPASVCVVFHEGQKWHLGELRGPAAVGQTFTCPEDELARLEVQMGTYGGWSASELVFSLFEEPPPAEAPLAALTPGDGQVLPLRPGQRLEQFFEPARRGLRGLKLMLSRPERPSTGRLRLTLSDPDRPGEPIRQSERLLAGLPGHGFALFPFPVLADSAGRRLKASLSLEGAAEGLALRWYWPTAPVLDPENASFVPLDSFTVDGRLFHGRLLWREAYKPLAMIAPPVVRKDFSSIPVSDNAFHAFSFAPRSDSAGKRYLFLLQAPQAAHHDAVTLWADVEGRPGEYLWLDGVPTQGSLAFRAYRLASKREVLGRLAGLIAADKPFSFGRTSLMILALLAQVAGGVAILRLALKIGAD